MLQQRAQSIDDRQAESQPLAALVPVRLDPVELGENISPLILGNANAGIANVDAQAALQVTAPYDDAADARIANGIRNEIEEDALQENGIALHPGRAWYDAKMQALLLGGGQERRRDARQYVIDGEGSDAGGQRAGVQS